MLDVGGKPVSPFPQRFEAACVSTANHSQMCARSFTSRIMAIPTHVVRVCVCVGVCGSGEHGLDGASVCKQQSGCHLIIVSLKSTRAMLRWDTDAFPFQGQLFFTPSIKEELCFSRKQPTMGETRSSRFAAAFKTTLVLNSLVCEL